MMVHMAFKVRCYCGEVGKRGRHDGPQWPSRCVTTVERWGRGADMMVQSGLQGALLLWRGGEEG